MEFAVVYVDDICIALKSFDEHMLHLDKMFCRLKQFNVTLKLNKSSLCKNRIKCLGYIISDMGIIPDEEKV